MISNMSIIYLSLPGMPFAKNMSKVNLNFSK